MDRVINSSSSSSKSSRSSIYNARELIANEYKPRFMMKYKGQVMVTDGYKLNFYIRSVLLKKSKTILDLKKVLKDGDAYLLRPGKDAEYLMPEVIYNVKIAVNFEQLMANICSKSQEKRENIIVITNGPDIGDLNKIQANEVTSLKAIIWFNAGLRRLNFTDAANLIQFPHEKIKNKEAIEKINELTIELQEVNEKYEESKKREEAYLKRIMELEEEKEKTLKRNN